MVIKQTIILIINVYAWLIVLYVIFNFLISVLKINNKITTTLKETTYGMCEPILKGVKKFLPNRFWDFAPVIAYLILQILLMTVTRFNV
ncbi:MAG: YggT family protein [Bacilli bacterium]